MQGQHAGPVRPISVLLGTGLTILAIVHGLLYLYWLEREAYPHTLALTGARSAEQIFNANDPYYTMRKFVRQRAMSKKKTSTIVLVGEAVKPPSRFDLEVYYQLYPELPLKVAANSVELTRAVAKARSGTAFISVPQLKLDPQRFTTIVGEQYCIYIRK